MGKDAWRKAGKNEFHQAEEFLRAREKFCVSASSRFLHIKEGSGHVWQLKNRSDNARALLLHYKQSLFPVFNKNNDVPGPRFLNRFLGKVNIHALQGLKEDVETLENLMEQQSYYVAERINYDLMSLEDMPNIENLKENIPGLLIRLPLPKDTEELYKLQSAYEKEEVVPKTGQFDPVSCRYNLQRILTNEKILVAEMDGRVVGKINTSSRSFAWYQIGGVYVNPEYRNRGIAVKMTAVFLSELLNLGMKISLFVKKHNLSAKAVYKKLGFTFSGDYRISYY